MASEDSDTSITIYLREIGPIAKHLYDSWRVYVAARKQPVFHHSNLSDTAPVMRGRAWKCAISRRADLALNVIQKMFVLKFREALFGTKMGVTALTAFLNGRN